MEIRQQRDRCQNAQAAHQLRGAYTGIADIQAVGAQKLREETDHTVPADIDQADLSAEFAFFTVKVQEQKSGQIPQGFVQKRGMHRHAAIDDHAPGQAGGAAVGLGIDEISPPADALRQQKAQTGQVKRAQQVAFVFFAEQHHHDHRGDDGTVDGQTAVPHSDDLAGMGAVIIPFAQNVIDARPDDGAGQAPKHRVDEPVRIPVELRTTGNGVQDSCQKSCCQNDAVPHDVLAKHGERHPVDLKHLIKQSGK